MHLDRALKQAIFRAEQKKTIPETMWQPPACIWNQNPPASSSPASTGRKTDADANTYIEKCFEELAADSPIRIKLYP